MVSIVQNGPFYEIRFPYNDALVSMVKQVPGRQWHPEDKFWSVPKDKVGFFVNLVRGTSFEQQLQVQSDEDLGVNTCLDVTSRYEIPDIDISDVPQYVQKGGKLYQHQIDCLKYSIGRKEKGNFNGFLLADEPGCVSGESRVQVSEPGKPATRHVKIKNLLKVWSKDSGIRVKSLVDDRFAYVPIKDIIDKGVQECVKITLENNNTLVCTPDHEIYTERGWVAASNLLNEDTVATNGTPVCKNCGSTKDVITKGGKFNGYCRKCMYKLRYSERNHNESVYRKIDKNGYVVLTGTHIRASEAWDVLPKQNTGGVLEHHYVWWKNTGHVIDTSREVIHHVNHVRTDNRFENLQLLTLREHRRIHIDTSISNLLQFNSKIKYVKKGNSVVWLVPNFIRVKSIERCTEEHVYDIAIDHPTVHNFVCNNIVVHNCGKTLEVINLALFKKKYEGAKHCLIICCVNSAKYNWSEDITKHTNGEYEGYILGSRKQKRKGTVRLNGSSAEKLKDLETGYKYSDNKAAEPLPYFLILNVEALRMTDKSKKKAYRNVITLKIVEMCLNGDITMIALDEIHNNASPQSEQGKQILKIKELTQNRVEWLPMTGTPIVNRPTDLFLPLRLVEAHHSNSYWMWNQHYCIYGGYGGHNVMGYKNIPELKSILEPNMLRRTKEQVLDLPDKVRHVEYVENSKAQVRLYQQTLDEIKGNIDEVYRSVNPLGRLVKLRQVNGCPELVDYSIDPRSSSYLSVNAKMRRTVDLVQDIVNSGDKVVVFSNWIEPLRSLYRQLKKKKLEVASYTGSMSQEAREQNKSNFVNNPNCKVILGTIGALGTSHTLTVARSVVFFDEPWSMAALEQAEDRCHRVTSTGTVNIYSVIAKDTVDEKVHNILTRKGAVSDFIVDNELNVRENPELLKFLLQ